MKPHLLSISTLFDLSKLSVQEVIVDFIIVFSVILTIRWVIQETKQILDAYAKAKEQEHQNAKLLKDLYDKTCEQQEDINALKKALKDLLADRLSEKYNYYKELGYIPEDEYEQYCDMHTSYNGVGGNHTGDKKFEQSMELPVG